MNVMKIDNIESLLDIHYKTGIDMNEMINTADTKAVQYRMREAGRFEVIPTQQNFDDAIFVMQRYARIHYGYNRSE